MLKKPALSIGNVGQLAMDLLVSSTRAERIGFFDDPFLLPCVGNDAYGPQPQGQLALPLEGQLFKTKKYILFSVPSKFLLLACYVTLFFGFGFSL